MNEAIKQRKQKRETSKVITMDVMALRRMRLSRKVTREEAGKGVGVSAKMIERFENGRTSFTEERKKALIRKYKYSLQEYSDLIEGKLVLPDVPARSIYRKRQKTEQEKRKYQKIITKEVRIIKAMRRMKKLTQPQAGIRCGYHRSVIDHLENGRVILTPERIKHIVKSYGFTMSDFEFMQNQKIIRDEAVKDCQGIIEQLDNEKLQAVQALLQNFR